MSWIDTALELYISMQCQGCSVHKRTGCAKVNKTVPAANHGGMLGPALMCQHQYKWYITELLFSAKLWLFFKQIQHEARSSTKLQRRRDVCCKDCADVKR